MHNVYKPGEYPKEHNYEEICPYCDEPIAVVVEDYCYDYDATCPVYAMYEDAIREGVLIKENIAAR